MRLFVTNISREARSQDLRNVFSEYGRVLKVWLIEDPMTGDHKGQGFVEMSFGDAMIAMKALNRSWFKNKRIHVQKSRPMPSPQRDTRRADFAHS